ncbi:diguanylate cyclase [Coleofasciculus sp. FACHB-1120]|uniref:diguanylate cyclase n=1 Tax=Coleofasciculus sp. FACHB-1120 TaxID=2692783 RepID=UPI0016821064|nr:diguanylate cyclase [Coleofasciculus sp. FACHB-1120]MBD2740299.1 diguanylate cyclase [Coleofasciculus sp. FACHB-1120]
MNPHKLLSWDDHSHQMTPRRQLEHLEEMVTVFTEQPIQTNEQLPKEILEGKSFKTAISESERRLQAIFNQTSQFIALLQSDGIVIEANQTALDFGGIAATDVIGRPFWEASWWSVSPKIQEGLKCAIAQAASGEFVNYEVEVRGAGETIASFDFSLKLLKLETELLEAQQTPPLLIAQGQNITECKHSENQLTLCNLELLTLYKISEIAQETQSLHTAFQEIVEQISIDTGFPIITIELYDEARQMMVFAGLKGVPLPADTTVLEVPVDATLSGTVVRTGQPVVKTDLPQSAKNSNFNKIFSQAGIKTFICMPMIVNQRSIGVLSLAHLEIVQCNDSFLKWIGSLANSIASLTERKQAEQALRENEARYRRIVETTVEGVWVLDPEGNTAFVNNQMAQMLGVTAAQMLGKPLFAFMDDEGRAIAEALIERRRQGIKEQHDFKFRRQDGSDLWAIVSTNPIFDRAGNYAGVLGMVTDITQRKATEEALLQQAKRELLIRVITHQIRQSLKLEEILNTTVTEVRQFLACDRVVIFRFHPDWSGVIAVESVDSRWTPILGSTMTDHCFAHTYVEPYKNGRILAIEDIYTAGISPCHIDLLAQFQVRANLVVPILQGEDLWGLLIAHHCSQPRQWQQIEINLLQELATQAGIAIKQAQLYQQLEEANQELQRLAVLDGLTQVANRRCFDQYMNSEWQRLLREQVPLSLILGDIDFFKPYNDTYGHQAGDECLKAVASAIRRAVGRSTDLVARYGGEEFAIILPNTMAEGAIQVAEKIRAEVKALAIAHVNSQASQQLTLSLGIASVVPTSESSPAMLISAADTALYQAKAAGRDRYYAHH